MAYCMISTKVKVMVLIGSVAAVMSASSAEAVPITTKDVSNFTHFWGFEEAPGNPADSLAVFDSYSNVDGTAGADGTPDFHQGSGNQAVHAGGTLTTKNGGNYYNDVFPAAGPVLASSPNGYTVEYQVRALNTSGLGVSSYDAPTDRVGAGGWNVLINESTGMQEIFFGAINGDATPDAAVPVGEFITIREAVQFQAGNIQDSMYTIYVNGVAAVVDQNATFAHGAIAGRFIFGDLGGNYGGEMEVEYLAFDVSGAHAPIPEPASLALLSLGALSMLRRR